MTALNLILFTAIFTYFLVQLSRHLTNNPFAIIHTWKDHQKKKAAKNQPPAKLRPTLASFMHQHFPQFTRTSLPNYPHYKHFLVYETNQSEPNYICFQTNKWGHGFWLEVGINTPFLEKNATQTVKNRLGYWTYYSQEQLNQILPKIKSLIQKRLKISS